MTTINLNDFISFTKYISDNINKKWILQCENTWYEIYSVYKYLKESWAEIKMDSLINSFGYPKLFIESEWKKEEIERQHTFFDASLLHKHKPDYIFYSKETIFECKNYKTEEWYNSIPKILRDIYWYCKMADEKTWGSYNWILLMRCGIDRSWKVKHMKEKLLEKDIEINRIQ